MTRKPPHIVVEVRNPSSFSGRGSIIVLELADEDAARKVAQQIARETGRSVTVRGEDMAVIDVIPAVKSH
ncbi:hypothetical protein CT676_41820 [Bradyrhizobium sp. MOS001]|jgi:hypothetical protein|uniref:Uncharacterized protein n=1 Tax=Bradyrhizobium japonicum TaxID=375 RepID=A0A1Y2JX96_BRAJP|nr:hypothetical protein BSZ19_02340 [Bradyrhizobium japonicum]TFW52978.1 hypothetical protein CT676_41820 [Bradyrhizobium sp. MOS001]